jgi:hypothetical protein
VTGEDRLSPPPFFSSCPDPKQGMSVNKLRIYLNTLPDSLTGTQTLTPLLLSDSKGLYLEKHILPGVDQRIQFCCKNSRNTTKGLNRIRDHLDYKIGNLGDISLYIWLGTCDLTSYNKGYISLHTD